MKNVKDQIYAALCKAADNVTDVYPANWAQFPVIQYTEEDNSVIERTDNKEDKEIATLGLVRTACMDVPDPSGLKHKQMRYEGIIDMDSDLVYWNN